MKDSTRVQGSNVSDELTEASACRHQWLVDAPAGPSSKGVCRTCGEERHFQNYIEGSAWGYDVSLEDLSGGSRYPSTGKSTASKSLAEDE